MTLVSLPASQEFWPTLRGFIFLQKYILFMKFPNIFLFSHNSLKSPHRPNKYFFLNCQKLSFPLLIHYQTLKPIKKMNYRIKFDFDFKERLSSEDISLVVKKCSGLLRKEVSNYNLDEVEEKRIFNEQLFKIQEDCIHNYSKMIFSLYGPFTLSVDLSQDISLFEIAFQECYISS